MLDNFSVICLRPQGSANLGAIARAMKNFGLGRLILVSPRCEIDGEARRMACHAGDVLDRATRVENLEEVLDRFQGLAGTTGKPVVSAHGEPLSPSAAMAGAVDLGRRGQVGLLLGPEDHGLSNEELKLCRWIVRIPTSPGYPSLNIAQAATILFYELHLCQGVPVADGLKVPRATAAEVEQYYAQLRELLLGIGFLHQDNPERIMYVLRRLLARAEPDQRELRILRGIVRQLSWALRHAPENQSSHRDTETQRP